MIPIGNYTGPGNSVLISNFGEGTQGTGYFYSSAPSVASIDSQNKFVIAWLAKTSNTTGTSQVYSAIYNSITGDIDPNGEPFLVS